MLTTTWAMSTKKWGGDEAIAAYQHAVVVKPDFPEAHNNLGVILNDFDRLEEATVIFYRALEITPDLLMAHGNVGTSFVKQNRFVPTLK
jgi:protein O-GlcNAc transferase